MSSSSGEASNTQGERGVTLTLVIVLACFLLSWLPYIVYTNYGAIVKDKKNDIPYYLNPLAYCFGYMNSACNPLIYAWRIPRFRQGYKDIFNKTKYFVTIDNVPPKTGDESEETTSLSVNGQKASDYKRSAPQTERLTSIEEKQAEDVFNTDQL